MRFLHTADWHLGRLFHGQSLTGDQEHVLDQIVELARTTDVQALVVAGDLYDRSVPPVDAVRLLDDVFCRVALGLGVPVIAIAGNHDSPDRVGFGSRLMQGGRVHVFGALAAEPHRVTLCDAHGPVHFYAIPYAEPAVVRERYGADDAREHDAAMAHLIARAREAHADGGRSVAVAHAYVGGGTGSESERPLSIGGAETVSASHFDAFEYVALGHLHRPQTVGRSAVRYSGSPLKYSFSEASDAKCVKLVDMDATGACRVEQLPLTPRRDVRRVAGTLADLTTRPGEFGPREDYLEVRLLDDGPVLDAMARLRDVFPNVLHIERSHLDRRDGDRGHDRRDHRTISEATLFTAFFDHVTGTGPTADQLTAFADVLGQVRGVVA